MSVSILCGYLLIVILGWSVGGLVSLGDEIEPLTMNGRNRMALPANEYARRNSTGSRLNSGQCDPDRAAELLREAGRLIWGATGPGVNSPPLTCFRVSIGRYLYRFEEGETGLWRHNKPIFYDRFYARTMIREAVVVRVAGLLDDRWFDRTVHAVGVVSRSRVLNAALIEDAIPPLGEPRLRTLQPLDPRHLRAIRKQR